jgi:hypothetical protein
LYLDHAPAYDEFFLDGNNDGNSDVVFAAFGVSIAFDVVADTRQVYSAPLVHGLTTPVMHKIKSFVKRSADVFTS